MRRLVVEVHDALKPGGSFLLVESPSYKHHPSFLILQAEQIGFKRGNSLGGSVHFLFTADRTTTRLDNNGFAHYEHAPLVKNEGQVCLQLIKPK